MKSAAAFQRLAPYLQALCIHRRASLHIGKRLPQEVKVHVGLLSRLCR